MSAAVIRVMLIHVSAFTRATAVLMTVSASDDSERKRKRSDSIL